MKLIPILILSAWSCALVPTSAIAAAAPCALSQADQAWLDEAMIAWNYTSSAITGIGHVKNIKAVFFDDKCVVTSTTAMNGGPAQWEAQEHSGEVTMPDGEKIPAGVTSFASADDKVTYFAMSTPSVWRTAVKSHNGLGSLEKLMTAVVLHEASHVSQVPTYGKRIGALSTKHKLPDDFNDDSIQKRFESNAEFKASIGREVDNLIAAATARDLAEAVRLANAARSMIKARQARWFKGSDAYLAEAEDIWLSFEGSAQWAAYQWLIDPRGGGIDPRAAFGSFGWHGKWWSQNEGFALFMALDRLAPGDWKKHAFGDGAKTILEMLDEAIARTPN